MTKQIKTAATLTVAGVAIAFSGLDYTALWLVEWARIDAGLSSAWRPSHDWYLLPLVFLGVGILWNKLNEVAG